MKNISIFIIFFLVQSFACAQPFVGDVQREELRKKADENRERNAREREEIQKNFSPSSSTVNQRALTSRQVCKATVAALMGHSPNIINVDREQDGVVYLVYARPSDGTVWRSRCRVSGTSVVWAADPGRWRDNPLDEKINFHVDGANLVVRRVFSDGSVSDKIYQISNL